MSGTKSNCWEVKKCGREQGGPKTHDLGVCPASTNSALDGVHGGKNSGRACWVVVGTLCGGAVQGTFAKKSVACENCDFYLRVKKEQSSRFILSPLLLKRLQTA